MLLDEKDEYLSVKAAFGPESDMKIKMHAGEGIAGDVLKTGRPELIDDVSDDSRFLPGTSKIKSMLCVPIGCEGRNFGVINMSSVSEKVFTANDLKLLRTLAVYASIAIQNEANFFNLKNATDELLRYATLLDAR
jgi:GAF domain-containing protein